MVRSAETGTLLEVFSPLEQEGHFFPLGWSRDSRLIYVFRATWGAGEPDLALIDVETQKVVESTVLSPNVVRASLSPSGNYLAMLLRPADPPAGQEQIAQLVLRSLEDGSEKLLKEGIRMGVVWDFDSRHLFYRKPKEDNRLYYFSIETEEETVLVDDMQDLGIPRVSPDGKYWVFEKQGGQESRIWVLENFLPESPEGKDQAASR